MSGTPEPKRRDLYAYVKAVIDDALPKLREHIDAGRYVSKHYDWLKLDRFASGFPHIVSDLDADVPNYGGPFGLVEGQFTPIAVGDWPTFKAFAEFVRADAEIAGYLSPFGVHPIPNAESDVAERFFLVSLTVFLFGIFDRVISLHGLDFSEEQLLSVYCERERGLLDEQLAVFVLVPIALTHFETTEPVVVGPAQFVAPIRDELQLARMPRSHTGVGVENAVIGAATHAFVRFNWLIPNPDRVRSQPDVHWWYPTAEIDRFFDALRVVTGLETGYAQAVMIPRGWATSYRANLPVVTRSEVVRRFPPSFEKWGWLTKRRVVTAAELDEVRAMFEALETHRGSLALAASRLSEAMLREAERDSVLDLVIGLEALLGDSQTTEVTHKLALRVAAVLSRWGLDPREVFDVTKHLYRYRSAVAHGDESRARKREKYRTGAGEERTIDVAQRYLRLVIRVLRDRPDLHDGEAVDRQLILPAFKPRQEPTFAGPRRAEP